MTKEEKFLWLVQTATLANAINLSSDPTTREKYQAVYSCVGVLGTMQEAIQASEKIPGGMSADKASSEFCGYMLRNLRDIDASARLPDWLAR